MSYVTNLALWLQYFNKLTYLKQSKAKEVLDEGAGGYSISLDLRKKHFVSRIAWNVLELWALSSNPGRSLQRSSDTVGCRRRLRGWWPGASGLEYRGKKNYMGAKGPYKSDSVLQFSLSKRLGLCADKIISWTAL